MQQLDYWFANSPKESFYKFLQSCDSEYYRSGDSWTEELAMSADEFRSAFDKIGVRYTSKTSFKAAGDDPFQGKFYCSYFDKKEGKTHYFRNHAAVDAVLDSLVKNIPSTVDGNSNLQEKSTQIPVNGNSNLQGLGKSISLISTETNTEIISDNNNTTSPVVVEVVKTPTAATQLQPTAQANSALTPQMLEAIIKLDAFGIANGKARDLINTGGADLCLAWLHSIEKTNQTAIKKLGSGFLIRKVTDGETPAGYVAPQERAAQHEARERATRDGQKQKAQAVALSEAESARLDDEWEDMGFDLRDEIEIETRDRLGVLFQEGKNSAAFAAMRRQVQRGMS